MYNGIIFDVDQTLVDTSKLKTLRDCRNWGMVYEGIPTNVTYIQLSTSMISILRSTNLGIATHGKRQYFQKLMNSWKLGGVFLSGVSVCGREAAYKPSPDSLLRCANTMNIQPSKCIYVGDSPNDILAAKAAGMLSIGVSWFLSSTERLELLKKRPDCHFQYIESFQNFILRELK